MTSYNHLSKEQRNIIEHLIGINKNFIYILVNLLMLIEPLYLRKSEETDMLKVIFMNPLTNKVLILL